MRVPLDAEGQHSRLLMAGDVATLPWDARRTSRVQTLIHVGTLQELNNNVAAPMQRVLEAKRATPGVSTDAAEPEEDLEMPDPGIREATRDGNGAAAPRAAVKPAKRKARLSGAARRKLALEKTTKAATEWAAGNGNSLHAATRVRLQAEAEAARFQLANRALAIAEAALELLRPA